MVRKKRIAAGALVVLAIAGIAFYAVTVWWATPFESRMVVEFNTVPHLHPGAPVRISGIVAGSVEAIHHVDKSHCGSGSAAAVHLTIAVDPEMVLALRGDAMVYLTTVGPLGEKYVEIDAGTPSAPSLNFDRTLCGVTPTRLEVYAAQTRYAFRTVREMASMSESRLAEVRESVGHLKGNASSLSDQIRSGTGELASGAHQAADRAKALASNTLLDPALGKQLSDAGVGFQRAARSVRSATRSTRSSWRQTDSRMGATIELFAATADDTGDRGAEIMAHQSDVESIVAGIRATMSDVRRSVGAFANDLEIQNHIKGMQIDLKRRFLKYLFSGGKKIEAAR